ncbi:CopG family ribbon-helix-helix protein [Conexibacter woesei]|uniref:Putative transcriptional regulator, CopG family n=1 Tax=Conexibacter woesei (strain DSM 14684 / CCUG 47730 / CIP 108061 / JCM 11494 / NBRC 100937 / ID131577) TaxID=469383 RepID=D3F540_CONWI|nr:ribbon-helix-helix protein, CopG family [Conexibacter woesei]ADB48618.1 putative transcriptional regulator, CopG family [Conexibacter woesei DSM 14684]
MAKVMISLPDDLLERFDTYAQRRRTTRSGLLRELAEHELAANSDARRRRVDELLANPGNYGGHGTRYVREDRNRDNP